MPSRKALNFTEYRELVHRYPDLCRWYVYCRLQNAIFGVDPRSIRCHSCFCSIYPSWFTHEGFEQLHSMRLGATRSAHATLATRQCNLRSIAQLGLGSSGAVKLGLGGEVRGSKLNPSCVVHVLPDLVWKTGGFETHGELSNITYYCQLKKEDIKYQDWFASGICAWGNMIVVRTQELAYIFERYTLCFLFRTRQPFFNNMLPKCSVPKWPSGPNLLKLKNKENASGSNPPFALPSHARRKKEKRSAAAAQWCVILFHFAQKRMSCSIKGAFLDLLHATCVFGEMFWLIMIMMR